MKPSIIVTLMITITCLAQASADNQFKPIFNGIDLTGWTGDPNFWSVKDNCIVGNIPEGTQLENHSYLIWQGGTIRNFELTCEFKTTTGNSGIDYRATRLQPESQTPTWILEGYQFDIINNWMASLYNWGKPGAQPGQFVHVISKNDKARLFDYPLADPNLLRQHYYKSGQWNRVHIIARGNHIIHRLNNYQTVEFIDAGPFARYHGLLGFQLHRGRRPSLQQFRNIQLKTLPDHYSSAQILFDGSTLENFTPVDATPDDWQITENAFTTKADKGFLKCNRLFRNYILRFQYISSSTPPDILIDFKESDPEKSFRLSPLLSSVKVPRLTGFWNDMEIQVLDTKAVLKTNGTRQLSPTLLHRYKAPFAFDITPGKKIRNVILIPIEQVP